MTSNQIAARAAKETERANRAKEAETMRSNRVTEKLKRDEFGHKSSMDKKNLFLNTITTGTKFASGLGNDPSWYSLDKQMVNDAASISFETPLGYTQVPGTTNYVVPTNGYVYLPDHQFPEKLSTGKKYSVGGVMGLAYIPMLGNSSIAQTAGLNIYAYVRHANSGSRNYEYQDLIKYLYAVDSIYIGIAELKRIYSILNTFKAYNRFYCDGYLNAISVVNDDTTSIATLRYKINQFVQRVNSLYVPNVMSMYIRHDWMSSTIYKDAPVKRSSNYVFYAKYIYKFNEDVNSKSFGSLVPQSFMNGNTITKLIEIVDKCLTALQSSEDIGIMSGDILKAYGNSNMYSVKNIDDSYHIEEVYSPEVLTQINAAEVLDKEFVPSFYINEDESGNLVQGFDTTKVEESDNIYGLPGKLQPFCLVTNYKIPSDATNIEFPKIDHIINMYKDDATPDDNMVASRLMVNVQPSTIKGTEDPDWKMIYKIMASGTEILLGMNVVFFDLDSNTIQHQNFGTVGFFEGFEDSTIHRYISILSTFDWAPRIQLYMRKALSSGTVPFSITKFYDNKDLCNYAIISSDTLLKMHQVALNSELGVPLLGEKVRN